MKTLEETIQTQIGALVLQVLQLQAENAALKAKLPAPAPAAEPAKA